MRAALAIAGLLLAAPNLGWGGVCATFCVLTDAHVAGAEPIEPVAGHACHDEAPSADREAPAQARCCADHETGALELVPAPGPERVEAPELAAGASPCGWPPTSRAATLAAWHPPDPSSAAHPAQNPPLLL